MDIFSLVCVLHSFIAMCTCYRSPTDNLINLSTFPSIPNLPRVYT